MPPILIPTLIRTVLQSSKNVTAARVLLTGMALLMGAVLGGPPMVLAADSPRPELDLAVERDLLAQLLADGHYHQAIAETDRLEKLVRPRKKDAEYAARATAHAEVLLYRGVLQTRTGNLDDAEKTLREANRLIEETYRTLVATWRHSRGRVARPTEATAALDLLGRLATDATAQLHVQRLRQANQQFRVDPTVVVGQRPSPTVEPSGDDEQPPAQSLQPAVGFEVSTSDDVDRWIDRLDEITFRSLAIQESPGGSPAAKAKGTSGSLSPFIQTIGSQCRPRMYAGLRLLESSKLPWSVADPMPGGDDGASKAKRTEVTESAEQRSRTATRQRSRAITALEQAEEDLGRLFKPPSISQTAKPETGASEPASRITLTGSQQEIAMLHAELQECLAEAYWLDDRIPLARERIDLALTLRRAARGDSHPELARASILSAEIAMREAGLAIEAQQPRLAKEKADLAVSDLRLAKELVESEHSEFAAESPLHALLASLLDSGDQQRAETADAVAAKDAADAAAARALSVIRRQDGIARPQRPKPAPQSDDDVSD